MPDVTTRPIVEQHREPPALFPEPPQTATAPVREQLAVDRLLFEPPFILIGGDNDARYVTASLSQALTLLIRTRDFVSVVGTLRRPWTAVDIDPADTGQEAEAGVAIADDLTSWADRMGLPWLQRASGRPGHFHVIIKTPNGSEQFLREVATRVSHHHGVSVTVRRTLRLTCAPHRHGLPSPVLAKTLIPTDLPAPRRDLNRRGGARTFRQKRANAGSRSEREFGDALALARAGVTTAAAWVCADRNGSKARQIGQRAWRRWFWAPATTIVAAEQGVSESIAWRTFTDASPAQARHLGLDSWRRLRWRPALDAAVQDRPRRRRVSRAPAREASECSGVPSAGFDAVRLALERALTRLETATLGVRPHSMRAALETLAEAIAYRHGSISVRAWAERSHLDPKTVRRSRDAAERLGLIRRKHSYRGGPSDCDAWDLGEQLRTTMRYPQASSSTPYTPTRGRANRRRLQLCHARERSTWNAHLARQRATRQATRITAQPTTTERPLVRTPRRPSHHCYLHRGKNFGNLGSGSVAGWGRPPTVVGPVLDMTSSRAPQAQRSGDKIVASLLLPVRASARPEAAPLPVIDLAEAVEASSVKLSLVRVDSGGVVAARTALGQLGWCGGQSVNFAVSSGLIVASRQVRTAGIRLSSRLSLFLPARMRQRCRIRAGEQVLLGTLIDHDLLVVYPQHVMHEMLAGYHASMSDSPKR
ncbi:hypothetical protein ACQPXB_21150 [Amycolatopsis sp. CA-161197]|uniref:hypothetical protein n=1 Tax=Amycolatopsis sp. CA-161197 TaxID=3239922 RepID=UPI003D92DE3F